MLSITPIHQDQVESIYHFLQEIETENGFHNPYFGVSFEDFKRIHLKELLQSAKGIIENKDYVPQTYFFLWLNSQIIGVFKVRHCLNEKLINGSGHIGFSIHPKFRGQGYATKGLKLIIDEIKPWIKEDEIYMSCFKHNEPSLKVQLANGAYIHHENEDHFFTRIKIR